VCHDFIPASPDGSIRYNITPVWEDRWCPSHAADGTRRCCGCERLEPRPRARAGRGRAPGAAPVDADAAAHAPLPDGRALCCACVPAAVVDEADAAPLYDDVLAFMASIGTPLPSRPPLRLVDAGVLEALSARADAPHEGGAVGTTPGTIRGVTLSEEVLLRPVRRGGAGFAGFGAGGAAAWGLGAPEALPLRAGCRVTCIAVLSALPALLAGSVLAHEAGHAYLRLTPGFPHPLPPRTEEGLCQLFALLWLQRRAAMLTDDDNDAASDPRAAAHAAQLAHAIRSDASEVYGGGARDALAAFQRAGLRALLDDVRRTGRIPPAP
jgi:hypothetical protein